MPSSDDTGMAATELSMIREVLNAEYDGGDASLDAASRTSCVRASRITRATRITHASRTTRADLAQTLAIEVGLPVAASAVDVQSLDEGELPTSGNAGVKNQAVSEAETNPSAIDWASNEPSPIRVTSLSNRSMRQACFHCHVAFRRMKPSFQYRSASIQHD